MMLVTVGSTRFPFQRMNKLVSDLAVLRSSSETIIFQYGSLAPTIHKHFIKTFPFIQQDELLSYMKRARIIICHGGPGTIYQSLSFGKIPWVLPRQKHFGEHLTDHQVDFCTYMAKRNLVDVVTDDTPLRHIWKGSRVAKAPNRHNEQLIVYLDSLMHT